jgi:LacI family transcriptional regulator
MTATIYDLAREAGVGIATVSRSLNNHPAVARDTRRRVLAIARRLHYQPHANAQRLASSRTNTFAAIIPFFTNYFFVQILQGIQDRALELGLDIVLHGVTQPSHAGQALARSLQRGRVDGVLYFSMPVPESFAPRIRQRRLPIVLVDGYHPWFDSIHIENRRGAFLAMQHLLGLGHQAIALINGRPSARPSQERLAGYRDALRAHNIPFSRARVFVPRTTRLDGFAEEAGRETMRELLQARAGGDPITAVLVSSDIQAIGALEEARRAGIRVPEDLAVLGFDDIDLARHMGLSTMRQPLLEMGVLALNQLHRRISDPTLPPSVVSFVPKLVVRRTCGGQPSDEPSGDEVSIPLADPAPAGAETRSFQRSR